jgi:hypothetical protein
MRTRFFGKSALGITLVALWLASDHSTQLSNVQAQPAPPPPTGADTSAVQPAGVTPPPNILPNSPLAEVIKLVQADVDENVIFSYVTNSTGLFNLDSDTIIYLSDLGVPNEVVTAMMQHDQVLQQTAAANPPPPESPTPESPPPSVPPEVTVDYFYSSLAPYGTWVNVGGYGRCWRPTTVVYSSSWQPYCDHGHWVYSDCGWYWVSDYSWGVTFHYGRWFRDAHLGWCWWPNTVWGPSWVTWRYSNDYCGWAPLPPFAVYRPGVGFFYRGNGVSIGFDFGLAVNCFTFVPTRNFCDTHPRHYRVGDRDETRIYNQTTVINNFNFDSHNRTVVNNGIAVQHITDVTRTPIHPVPVRQLSVSNRQTWRGGPGGQQNHGPRVTTGNPSHPIPLSNNRNNLTPKAGAPGQNQFSRLVNNQNPQPNHAGPAPGQTPTGSPAQNHFTQPANNQTLQPNRNWPDNSEVQTRNNENKHVASPRGQQFEEQTPHYNTPNNNATKPDQRQIGAPAVNSSAPVERPQLHNDSRSDFIAPSPKNVAPPTPPPASRSPQSSQSSQSSNKSNQQDQNQNGRGH